VTQVICFTGQPWWNDEVVKEMEMERFTFFFNNLTLHL
jgi:hypothetical protein